MKKNYNELINTTFVYPYETTEDFPCGKAPIEWETFFKTEALQIWDAFILNTLGRKLKINDVFNFSEPNKTVFTDKGRQVFVEMMSDRVENGDTELIERLCAPALLKAITTEFIVSEDFYPDFDVFLANLPEEMVERFGSDARSEFLSYILYVWENFKMNTANYKKNFAVKNILPNGNMAVEMTFEALNIFKKYIFSE